MNFKQKVQGQLLSLQARCGVKDSSEIPGGISFCADSIEPLGKVMRSLIPNARMRTRPEILQHTGSCFEISHYVE